MALPNAKTAMAAAGAFLLSGCAAISSIFGSHSARAPEIRTSPEAVDAQTAMARATAEGRIHLDEGRTGLAIESFQRALSLGAPSAETVNGLGVAFARLERFDLAQRYFAQARRLDPTDERYAANLSRVMHSQALAVRREGNLAGDAVAAADHKETSVGAAAAPAPSEPQPGELTRVSKHEFRIATIAPKAAPRQQSALATTQFKPLVRIEFGKTPAAGEKPSDRTVIVNPHFAMTESDLKSFKPLLRLNLPKPQDARPKD